jgi:hypothetical protein
VARVHFTFLNIDYAVAPVHITFIDLHLGTTFFLYTNSLFNQMIASTVLSAGNHVNFFRQNSLNVAQ